MTWHLVLAALSGGYGQRWGTAQDLTFGIPCGTFLALLFMSLFMYRSGHERAHRLQLLRERRRAELAHRRPEQLEAIHDRPQVEEAWPR